MLAVMLDVAVDDSSLTDLTGSAKRCWKYSSGFFATNCRTPCGRACRAATSREMTIFRRFLRGALDIPRQFMHHAVKPSRLACRFDELMENTPLNQVVKAAASHLARISRSPENRKRLRGLLFAYADIGTMSRRRRWHGTRSS